VWKLQLLRNITQKNIRIITRYAKPVNDNKVVLRKPISLIINNSNSINSSFLFTS
jgi:hypothetical protein